MIKWRRILNERFTKLTSIDFAENCNPFGPPPCVSDILKFSLDLTKVYPDHENKKLKEKLSTFLGIEQRNLMISNGSLESIFLLVQTLNMKIASILAPTFWGFEAAASKHGISVNRIPHLLGETEDDLIARLEAWLPKTTTFYFCNPNNPTLVFISPDKILKLAQKYPECCFVIDESALVMHPNFDKWTLSRHAGSVPNLVVVTSLSKLFNIPGLRVGFSIGHESLISAMTLLQTPYCINSIAQLAAEACLEDLSFVSMSRQEMSLQLSVLASDLKTIPFKNVYSGFANFLVVELPSQIQAASIAGSLMRNHRIAVRDATSAYPELGGQYLRIATNTHENNALLVTKLAEELRSDH